MQIKKEETREQILESAIDLFLENGVSKTSIARIAEHAGISTGNVYRYFSDKNSLVQNTILDKVGDSFKHHLKRTIELASSTDIQNPSTAYVNCVNEMLNYTIENRKVLLVLLSEEPEQFFVNFRSEVCQLLVASAQAYFAKIYPSATLNKQKKVLLKIIYRSFVDSSVELLKHYSTSGEILKSVALLRAYHLNGMKALFEES